VLILDGEGGEGASWRRWPQQGSRICAATAVPCIPGS